MYSTFRIKYLPTYIMTFHLALGQLWRCPIPWCSVWKGTTQDSVEHLRLRHHADSSVVASKMGKCFPPWTVTHAAWTAALGPKVSGIATDLMLFRQHGAQLVHRYRVYAYNLPHQSLRGSFMANLSRFTHQASAEARSATKRGRYSSSESASTLLGHAHRTPDSAPPARKSARATATVTSAAGASSDAPAPTQAPLLLQILDSSVPLAPADGPVSPGAPMPTLAGSPIVARFEPVNLPVSQGSRLSSVLLSANRVRQDFGVTQEDQYPLFDASPVSDGQLSPVSPAISRGSSPVGSEWDAESFHSAGVSLATSASLSITHRTAALKNLKPPPAPRPPVIQLNTDPSLLEQLATAYRDWLPQPPPDPAPFLAPSLFCEGPFDAASCPKATTRHPLIGTQQDGCPYQFTSYRDYEHSRVASPFGIQLHHPQFLE